MIINIRCPTCGKWGDIEISEESAKSISRGLLCVNIPHNTICPDSFIAYLDKNLKVRDYFVADFQIEIPQTIFEKPDKQKKLIVEQLMDIDLIKLNLPAILLSYLLRGIFLKKKMALIIEEDFLNIHIINFFNYITQDTFISEIVIISKDDYQTKKKQFRDYVVFDGNEIINDKDKIINPKKIAIEKRIIHQFIAESDKTLCIVMLKNEIHKAFELSKFIAEYINKAEDKKKIDINKISGGLQEAYKNKISSVYLNFLFEIVQNYFEVAIPSSIKLVLKMIF
ncbi:MAG: hypothetical protein EU532_11255 [Promethearchaeota archaeon]|nr:MAG: hypothetical protein EU532_11255 [Candidatus Lokiarchaeota archaeon]